MSEASATNLITYRNRKKDEVVICVFGIVRFCGSALCGTWALVRRKPHVLFSFPKEFNSVHFTNQRDFLDSQFVFWVCFNFLNHEKSFKKSYSTIAKSHEGKIRKGKKTWALAPIM